MPVGTVTQWTQRVQHSLPAPASANRTKRGYTRASPLTLLRDWAKDGHPMRGGYLADWRNWVLVAEASRMAGIPKRTLYHWIATDKLWSVRVGGEDGVIFVHRHDIELLMRERSAA